MSDEEILERWMQQYGASIQNVCYGRLNDHQLAEDAVQETFWKALCSYKKFRGDSSEKTWLTRIAINCCKNIQRKRQVCGFPVGGTLDSMCGEQELDAVLEKEALSEAVRQLKESDQLAIQQYYYQERPVRELAEENGISEAAVHQRLSRARRKLKLLLVTVLVLLCDLAGAALGTVQKNYLNQQALPELDPMRVVSTSLGQEKTDDLPETFEYTSYTAAQEALGTALLNCPEEDTTQGTVRIRTDGHNYAMLVVEIFCMEDNEPISLKADLVLSAEQIANLWSTDYLGAYRFVKQVRSTQGYKVDVLEETHSERPRRIAIFVADGVRYTLEGRVPENALLSRISSLK